MTYTFRDNNGINYTVKDIRIFARHIFDFHATGTSLHQENGHNFTVDDVNTKSGRWLHNFQWLKDSEIGSMHEEWNWLDGHSPEDIEAKNVHFTTGGPWFKEWKCMRAKDGEYAAEWNADYSNIALFRSKKDSIDEI